MEKELSITGHFMYALSNLLIGIAVIIETQTRDMAEWASTSLLVFAPLIILMGIWYCVKGILKLKKSKAEKKCSKN